MEGKSGKGPYGREGRSDDIQYMGGGKSGKGPYGREGSSRGYTVYGWRKNQGKGHIGEKVGVMVYSIWVEEESGKGAVWERELR